MRDDASGPVAAGTSALPATGHAAAVPAASSRVARRPGLDALRGLAVALVLLNHAAPGTFGAAGVLGVTIFFALSGWLITGVLMRDLDEHGRVRFGRFYAARALRLFPPLLLMLAGYVVVEGVFDLLGEAHLVPESLVAALTYTINVPGLPHGSESLYHFWTLATEEQFYLVWPLVLAWGWRRGLLRGAVGFSVAGTLVACMLTLLLVAPDAARVYALPSSWGAALLIGCAGYLGRDALVRTLPGTRRGRRAVQVGIVGALAAGTLLSGVASHTSWYVLGVPAVACGTVVLISYAGRWRGLPTRWLRPAVLLGTVSYAAYLWNGAIVRWVAPDDLLGTLAVVGLTLTAATASWWLVERPVARWRARRATADRAA
ncbi:acyltransferase family protein [Cellulomonas sp. Marseille-Q8402]